MRERMKPRKLLMLSLALLGIPAVIPHSAPFPVVLISVAPFLAAIVVLAITRAFNDRDDPAAQEPPHDNR